MKKKFILCACHYYRRIQSVKVQAIYSACLAAGVDCTVVPDLCRVSAKHEPINAEDCTILGCQTRAIKLKSSPSRRSSLGRSCRKSRCLTNGFHGFPPLTPPVACNAASAWISACSAYIPNRMARWPSPVRNHARRTAPPARASAPPTPSSSQNQRKNG